MMRKIWSFLLNNFSIKRKSSGNQHGLFSTKAVIVSNYLYFYKNLLVKYKKWECLNYITYAACGYTFAVSAYTSSLTLFLQLKKDRYCVDLLELSNFGNPNGAGTKKGYRRMRSKNTFDKGAKKTKSIKGSIISSIS